MRRSGYVLAAMLAAGSTALGGGVPLRAAPAYALYVSASADRAAPAPLTGATAPADAYIQLEPDTHVARVRFLLDGAARGTDDEAPYDFAGTDPSGRGARPWNTATVPEGTHTVTAAVDLRGGGTTIVTASFGVARAVSVDFSTRAAPLPRGYRRDFGQAYGPRDGGYTYGWVEPGSGEPLDLVGAGRDRDIRGLDQRLDTLVHMQGTLGTGAWEIDRPNGTYAVTVAAGDATAVDSRHQLSVEGALAVGPFTPAAGDRHRRATVLTRVSDGRLTVDATGGRNTKISYVDVVPAPEASTRPAVTGVSPAIGTTGVSRDSAVVAAVDLPTVGAGVDSAALAPTAVRLVRLADGAPVAATLNTSGGGDVVVLQPRALLAARTAYRFEITTGLRDTSGAPFLPYAVTFTTGDEPDGTDAGPIAFDKVVLPEATGRAFTSLAFGPDGRLYAGVVTGQIVRFPVAADGTLGTGEEIDAVRAAAGGDRMLMGLVFDPAATADDPVLWVTHTEFAYEGGTDFTGRVSRLSGPGLRTVRDVVVGLPRSYRDHLTNGLAFGPDGALYVNQGSNSAVGAPDNIWGQRREHALNAAVLRVDLAVLKDSTVDVKSADGGDYDPFAAGAPVTVYASGVRNAWDLVWHSNGQLYAPTNGSARGGATPSTPADLPKACARRLDGDPYAGPAVTGIAKVNVTQHDYLFRVERGGYYGHPDPARCEWVLNGGNPTAGADPAEVAQYPVGTRPDRNWRGAAYDFGTNRSPNGVIEYTGAAFGGLLRGALLVVRYSAGDDIIVLEPGADLDIASERTGIPGMTGFADPLDLTEHLGTGNLYVSEFGGERITLLRPRA